MNELLRGFTIESSQTGSNLREVREMLVAPDTLTVFDFDHTVFNTSSFHPKSFQGALNALGRSLDVTPELKAKYQFKGRDDEYTFRILLELSGGFDETLLLQAINERKNILEQMVKTDGDLTIHLMLSMHDVIRSLRTRGKKVGIASASPDSVVQEFVTRVNVDGTSISDVFAPDAIVGGTTVRNIHKARLSSGENTPSLDKPNPFSITLSASRLNGHGNDGRPILYVGDGKVDALSVRGRKNMVGLIINKEEYDELRKEFDRSGNIIVLKSIQEVLNAK